MLAQFLKNTVSIMIITTLVAGCDKEYNKPVKKAGNTDASANLESVQGTAPEIDLSKLGADEAQVIINEQDEMNSEVKQSLDEFIAGGVNADFVIGVVYGHTDDPGAYMAELQVYVELYRRVQTRESDKSVLEAKLGELDTSLRNMLAKSKSDSANTVAGVALGSAAFIIASSLVSGAVTKALRSKVKANVSQARVLGRQARELRNTANRATKEIQVAKDKAAKIARLAIRKNSAPRTDNIKVYTTDNLNRTFNFDETAMLDRKQLNGSITDAQVSLFKATPGVQTIQLENGALVYVKADANPRVVIENIVIKNEAGLSTSNVGRFEVTDLSSAQIKAIQAMKTGDVVSMVGAHGQTIPHNLSKNGFAVHVAIEKQVIINSNARADLSPIVRQRQALIENSRFVRQVVPVVNGANVAVSFGAVALTSVYAVNEIIEAGIASDFVTDTERLQKSLGELSNEDLNKMVSEL